MAVQLAVQSTTITKLLNSIQSVLVTATSINNAFVVESYEGDIRPRVGEPYFIVYRILDELPYMYAGANRMGFPSFLVLEVVLYTRLALDSAGTNQLWSRDESVTPDPLATPPIPAGRGNLIMRLVIQDALQGKNLFSVEEADVGTCITIEPLQQVKSPGPMMDTTDKTLGESHMFFQVKYVQPLDTSNDDPIVQ